MSPTPAPRQRIREVRVKGYKSYFVERNIELRLLTILAGANSSGKSSIMQPMLLMKQTLDASFDPGPLYIGGPHVRFSQWRQLFSHAAGSSSKSEASIALVQSDGFALTTVYALDSSKKGLRIKSMEYYDQGERHTLVPNASPDQLQSTFPIQAGMMHRLFEKQEKGKFEIRVERRRCFLELQVYALDEPDRASRAGEAKLSFAPSHSAETAVRSIIHVRGLRGNPERSYKALPVGDSFPGPFEEYFASVLSRWSDEQDDRLRQLGVVLERLGLSWKVHAGRVDDAHIELKVGRLPKPKQGGAQDLVNVADVGFGVSQVLPVLVALLVAEAGQIVFIEQPEIHLHPKAQFELAEVIRDTSVRGVQVVVETHSNLLLLGIQATVAGNLFNGKDVILHWCRRDYAGATEIESAELANDGSFGKWPEDLADAYAFAEGRYLKAVEDRHFGKK